MPENKDSDYINEHPDYYGEEEGNRMSNLADPKVTIAKNDYGVYVTIDFPIVDVDGYESTASYTVCLENTPYDDGTPNASVTFHDNQQFDDTHYRNVLPEFRMKEID